MARARSGAYSAARRTSGTVGLSFVGRAFHKLPRSTECYREAPDQYESEIADQVSIMGMQKERYG